MRIFKSSTPIWLLSLGLYLVICLPLYAFGQSNPSQKLPSRWISVPEVFDELTRGPVPFPHDLHTRAMIDEGCQTCHQIDEGKKPDFLYPRNANWASRDDLMNAYHDGCVGCHENRRESKLSSGPELCGECHTESNERVNKTYHPKDPTYYGPLRDTYHKDCLTCHSDDALKHKKAEALDWKSFVVQRTVIQDSYWPESGFSRFRHQQHEKALNGQCETCHDLPASSRTYLPERRDQLNCQDWFKEAPKNGGFNDRTSAHRNCVGCHLQNQEKKFGSGSPSQVALFCEDCHTANQSGRSSDKSQAVIQCNQKAKFLIQSQKQPSMPAVPFNHDLHQFATESCQTCHHHSSLDSCDECHTSGGIEKGGQKTLFEAHHAKSDQKSCVGCHELEKKESDCFGCHESMNTNWATNTCKTCHSGVLQETASLPSALPDPATLIPESVPTVLNISRLANEYQAARFPHLKITRTLTKNAEQSALAKAFHVDPSTICQGCHHVAPFDISQVPPKCETCHTARNEPADNLPTLLGAYHQSCLGCHKKMSTAEYKLPQGCPDCHEPAETSPTIFQSDN